VRLLRQGQEAQGVRRLFNDLERRQLAEVLAATNATANLLGRALVRDFQAKVLKRHGVLPEQVERTRTDRYVRKLGLAPDLQSDMSGQIDLSAVHNSPGLLREDISRTPIEPLPPEEAIRYFSQLVPGISLAPDFALGLRRTAFTLAVSTDLQLLGTVQDLIRERLATGQGISTAPRAIRDVLDRAGVTPRNPQYSEMVVRTNMMDSYNQGLEDERRRPDVADTFPVWQYLGIEDGREGDDHRPNFGKYYPASASFQDVRGPRVYNCRCVVAPVSKWEWARLVARGARIADGFSDVPVTVEA